MTAISKKNRKIKPLKDSYVFIDYLRAFATFFVIVIHNGDTFLSFNQTFSIEWAYANFLQSFARISVPLFFMISGFLLLKPNLNMKQFYSKRLSRILIPWLFWSVFYILFRIFFENNQISILSAIRLIWNGSVFYHLWFIYAVIGLYISIPFISRFIIENNKQQKFIILFTLIWFVSFSLIPFIGHFGEIILGVSFIPNFYLKLFTGFIGFISLGYLIGRLRVSRLGIYASIILFFFCYLITVLGNYYYNVNSSTFSEFFNGYTKPNIVLMAASVFYLFRAVKFKKEVRFIKSICTLSFGIYLAHPFLIYVFKNLEITQGLFDTNYIIIRTVLIFCSTWFIVYLISKIPILKKTI